MLSLCDWQRKCRVFVAGLFGLVISCCSSDAPVPMSTVSEFEVRRFLGQWHQVAAIPAWFQSDCVAHTTANYAIGEDDLIAVVNSCQTANGSRKQSKARARFLDDRSNGKLEVTFVEVFGLWVWPAAGDYWIIGVDPEYHWAVVGQPSREFAWIMARTPSLDEQTLQYIQHILERETYDTCKLLLTTPERQGRLCDVTGRKVTEGISRIHNRDNKSTEIGKSNAKNRHKI